MDQSDVRDCLSEGYAEVISTAVVNGDLDLGKVEIEASPLWLAPPSEEVTPAHLPYRIGRRFMYLAYRAGGWKRIDQLLATPPPSTEQVIHPGKLGGDTPTAVTIPAADITDLELRHTDTIGELTSYQFLLQAGAAPQQAFLAATGWDGDMLRVYRDREGGAALTWRIVWDRPIDAEQFREAVISLRPALAATTWQQGRVIDMVWAESPALGDELRDILSAARSSYPADNSDGTSTAAIEATATHETAAVPEGR